MYLFSNGEVCAELLSWLMIVYVAKRLAQLILNCCTVSCCLSTSNIFKEATSILCYYSVWSYLVLKLITSLTRDCTASFCSRHVYEFNFKYKSSFILTKYLTHGVLGFWGFGVYSCS